MIKTKLKAAGIHLFLSAIIVGLFTLFALTVWYPQPFFSISGLAPILIIIMSADIILGPLLTLVVYKPKKSTLKLDLAVITIVQLAALTYGMHTVYAAHPLYIAYAGDTFITVNANEVSLEHIKLAELKKSKLAGPSLVYVQKPSDPEELSRVTFEILSGKPDLGFRAEYYTPFDANIDTVMKKSISIDLYMKNTDNQNKLNAFLKKHGKTAQDYAFFPLVGKEKDVLWAFSRDSAKPVDILDISPWQQNQS